MNWKLLMRRGLSMLLAVILTFSTAGSSLVYAASEDSETEEYLEEASVDGETEEEASDTEESAEEAASDTEDAEETSADAAVEDAEAETETEAGVTEESEEIVASEAEDVSEDISDEAAFDSAESDETEYIEITELDCEYETGITFSSESVYLKFTPDESGVYELYANVTAESWFLWSYAYLYDSEWNELGYVGYGDPRPSDGVYTSPYVETYRVARYELTAGETYYIEFQGYWSFSARYSASFSVFMTQASRAVSAELVLTDSRTLELYQGRESYEAEGVDEDGNTVTYDCYDFTDLEFVSGDQIVITFEDGSTITYTSTAAGVFLMRTRTGCIIHTVPRRAAVIAGSLETRIPLQ